MSAQATMIVKFNRRMLLGAACAALVMAAVPAMAQAQKAGIAPQDIARSLTPVALDAQQGTVQLPEMRYIDKGAVEAFYAARNNEPYWLKGMGEGKRMAALVTVLEESWTHGLNPEKYHIEEIRALMEQTTAESRQRLEMTLTDAAMRYARDMSGMRVDAGALGLRSKFWRQPMKGDEIAQKMGATDDIPAMLRALAPQGELYRKLQTALAEQAQEAAKYDHLLPVTFGGAGMFKPGSSHKDVVKLRAYLKVEYNPANGPENFYDDTLAAAVMEFQRERSLEPDGILGPATMAVINKSHKDTMKQIVANLERLRWLDDSRPERYIMVNIPSQRLWAIENGKVEAEMNVIVGMPTRQTKQFKTEVTGVRFNPTWTVPLNLKMADFKPKLVNNPGYLHQKGIQVTQNGRTLDPHSVDWESVDWKEMNTMRFTQKPGDHNALGKIRILMPSDYDIYLHDTNHPEFFEKTQRTLSSGCIRLSDPRGVARFILKHNADWSDEKMEELIDRGRLVEVNAEKPFPVYIVYQSTWLDENGDIVFGPDVYRQDKMLADALARQDAYRLPEPGELKKDTADAGGTRPALASAR